MRVFGMKIKDIGLEFSAREEREKALVTFIRASTVAISDLGIRFNDIEAPFGTYERETKEIQVHCTICRGVFDLGNCGMREYQELDYNEKEVRRDNYICDGCLVAKDRATEVRKARAIIEGEEKKQ